MKIPYSNYPKVMKALVVDDDDVSRTFFELFLTRYFNCEVRIAENGTRAVEEMHTFTPDIIFLDILMPFMNGFEFIEHLRSQSKSKDISVVIVSAVDNRDVIKQMKNLGAKDYFLKPFPIEYARSRINSILLDSLPPASLN